MRSPIRRFANLTGQSASGRRPWNIARGSGSADGLAMKVKLPGAAASQCPLRTSARRSPYKPACDRPCDRRPRGHRGDLPHRRTAQRERLTPSVLRPWADSSALTRDNRAASATPPTFITHSLSSSDQDFGPESDAVQSSARYSGQAAVLACAHLPGAPRRAP